MINTVCRLISPMLFEEVYTEVNTENKVIIRPTYLSICHADQRYYQGKRSAQVLREKLPMALIHEGIGKVINDPTETFNVGDLVVMIPNAPMEDDKIISENYLESSEFRSSGLDGFMQDFIALDKDRVVKLPNNINPEIAAFTELVSVGVHAVNRFEKFANERRDVIGVWGDGNLGFIVALIFKIISPNSKIYVFGRHLDKLNLFTFADKLFLTDEVPEDLKINHAIECVGGSGSQDAINQIIDMIEPEGTIGLMGVSEHYQAVNTRDILSKGLHLFGVSRSGRIDFEKTVELYNNHPEFLSCLENIIGEVLEINTLNDIVEAFDRDYISRFGKTILIWNK